MAGKLPPETVKPVPEIESELMVTATVPLEVRVTDLVTAVPNATLPNETDVALRLKPGVAALSCNAKLCEELFSLAVSVAVCGVPTELTLAVNEAVDAPGTTDKLEGTVTAALLLTSVTFKPVDGAGELRDTVHAVAAEPVNELLAQANALIDAPIADADPLRLIDVVFDILPWVAVRFTVCEVLTLETIAAKLALVDPDGTETETGTLTAALLLARFTVTPPLGAAALNVTSHESDPAAIIDELAHVSPAKEAVDEEEPFPCNLTALATLVFVLVIALTLNCPIESVADPGS